jgi:hypothetical protein
MRKKKKTKQNKMRVRYYIEVLVEYSPSNQMRLGFSGSFRALAILHETFVQLWIEKYYHSTTKTKENDHSQLQQQEQQQENCHSSSSGLFKYFFHSFKSSSSNTTSKKMKQEEIKQKMLTEKVTKLPFPSKTNEKMLLLLLEKNEAKHNDKIESRQKALFEYFNELLNNGETSDLFLEYLRERSVSESKHEDQDQEKKTINSRSSLFKKMFSKKLDQDKKTQLEFKPPIYHRKILKSPKKKKEKSN